MQLMKYKVNHINVLEEDFKMDTRVFTHESILGRDDTISLDDGLVLLDSGVLMIKAGFKWDGASGPTIDTENTMRAALVHDALYRLMRNRKLDYSHRGTVDILFRKMLTYDGMNAIRAWAWYVGVRVAGGSSAKPIDGSIAICVN
jgi:hypothetical protein